VSDTKLRDLHRAAVTGSVTERVAWLRERARVELSTLMVPCAGVVGGTCHGTGPVVCAACYGTGRVVLGWPERFALGAYCGDEAARLIVGNPKSVGGYRLRWSWIDAGFSLDPSLSGWLKGLNRWPPVVSVRAAIAAGWVAWEKHAKPACPQSCERIEDALRAAEAWLLDPCENTWWEVHKLSNEGLPKFVSCTLKLILRTDQAETWLLGACNDAAGFGPTGPGAPQVRAAICTALVAWALA